MVNTGTTTTQQKIPSKNLILHVRNPERIVFEGEVEALSSINDKGPFDVLGNHGNFISIVKDRLIIYHKGGKKEDMKIEKGVLKVVANDVHVFLGLEALKK